MSINPPFPPAPPKAHVDPLPSTPAPIAEPGYQTTEFQGKVVAQGLTLLAGLVGWHLDIAQALLIVSGLEAVYIGFRSVRKIGTNA